MLRRYSENIDAVDPQLKNNKELLEIVEVYENSWSLGKKQLLDPVNKAQLLGLCLRIEQLCDKNQTFKEQIESFEAEIFLSIPSLVVLWSVSHSKDSSTFRKLCSRFCNDINFTTL